MPPPSERDLLKQCLAGEPEAWEALFDRHYAATSRFVWQLSGRFTTEDVEEICQETFLTVIHQLEQFRGGCQFQTWLFRVAANKAADYRQKASAAKRGGGQATFSLDARDPMSDQARELPSGLPGPDSTLLRKEESALVVEALSSLEPPCREVIELRYFGDLSYEEIASLLELNPKTVSSRLSKCLDKLETLARPLIHSGKPRSLPVQPSDYVA